MDAADRRHGQTRSLPAGTGTPVTATRGDFNDDCTTTGTERAGEGYAMQLPRGDPMADSGVVEAKMRSGPLHPALTREIILYDRNAKFQRLSWFAH